MMNETVPLSEQSDVSPMVASLRRRYGAFLIAVAVVYLCLAVCFAALPNSWFAEDAFGALDHWGRSVWPKLAHDAATLDARIPTRGTKYVIFMQCCLGMAIVVWLATLPANWRLISLPNNWMSYPTAKGWWKIPVGILILCFLTIFDQWFIGSTARRARSITNTSMLWFWMALLWWMLVMGVIVTLLVVARIWKHGRPESQRDYLLRKSREQK